MKRTGVWHDCGGDLHTSASISGFKANSPVPAGRAGLPPDAIGISSPSSARRTL
jgi:hypothetical protein